MTQICSGWQASAFHSSPVGAGVVDDGWRGRLRRPAHPWGCLRRPTHPWECLRRPAHLWGRLLLAKLEQEAISKYMAVQKANTTENGSSSNEKITFTLSGALLGAKRTIPVAISVFAIGIVFGVLARQAKMSVVDVLLMSGLVFAGASQFVALSLWTAIPFPVVTIIVTTFIINMRHMLMGASLRPWYAKLPSWKVYTTIFFMVDESWALTISDFAKGGRDAGFLLGSGFTLYLAWVSSSVIGRTAGAWIQHPAQWGLDFALAAVFTALLVGMWKGKSSLLPWIVAAAVAVAAAHWLPGKWYILLGGMAGSLVGEFTDAK
jgi:4-azaleucine resistance transporter AzlC